MNVMADANMQMIFADLRVEFIERGHDQFAQINSLLTAIDRQRGAYDHHILDIKRIVHSIKGSAGSFDFPTISHIAHAFEDYLEFAGDQARIPVNPARRFIQAMDNILLNDQNPGPQEAGQILENLPVPGYSDSAGSKTGTKATQHVNIIGSAIMVMPKSVQRKIIGRELAGFGLRVINVETGLQAIDLALGMRPRLIVTTMELDHMNGLELANALAHFHATEKTRIAVLTTNDTAAVTDAMIQPMARIIRKGPTYGRDMMVFLSDCGFC